MWIASNDVYFLAQHRVSVFWIAFFVQWAMLHFSTKYKISCNAVKLLYLYFCLPLVTVYIVEHQKQKHWTENKSNVCINYITWKHQPGFNLREVSQNRNQSELELSSSTSGTRVPALPVPEQSSSTSDIRVPALSIPQFQQFQHHNRVPAILAQELSSSTSGTRTEQNTSTSSSTEWKVRRMNTNHLSDWSCLEII